MEPLPESMRVIRDRAGTVDVDAFLARPLFAHLATAAEDGAPRDSPVWFLWEDGAVWIIGEPTDTFPDRVAREPRCAVGVVDFDRASGLVQHVGIRGRGTVEPWDPSRARRLIRRYLGDDESAWDPEFVEFLPDDRYRFVRVQPETVVARDVSYAASEG